MSSTSTFQQEIAALDPTKMLLFQIHASDGSVSSCYAQVCPANENLDYHVIELAHPDLIGLKSASNPT